MNTALRLSHGPSGRIIFEEGHSIKKINNVFENLESHMLYIYDRQFELCLLNSERKPDKILLNIEDLKRLRILLNETLKDLV